MSVLCACIPNQHCYLISTVYLYLNCQKCVFTHKHTSMQTWSFQNCVVTCKHTAAHIQGCQNFIILNSQIVSTGIVCTYTNQYIYLDLYCLYTFVHHIQIVILSDCLCLTVRIFRLSALCFSTVRLSEFQLARLSGCKLISTVRSLEGCQVLCVQTGTHSCPHRGCQVLCVHRGMYT